MKKTRQKYIPLNKKNDDNDFKGPSHFGLQYFPVKQMTAQTNTDVNFNLIQKAWVCKFAYIHIYFSLVAKILLHN